MELRASDSEPGIPARSDTGLGVAPHPHIGIQTVTWLLSGEALHRDSLGSEQVITMWWNFVARTTGEIRDAYRDWSEGSERFGRVASPLPRVEVDPPPR